MTTLHEAAQARAAAVAQRADRPSQRRSAEYSRSGARVGFRAAMQLRAADTGAGVLNFHGVASATEQDYEMWDFFGPYSEIVSAGAFADTLARSDLDVPFVIGHDQIRRIARTTTGTLNLAELDDGLNVDAPSLNAADADVAYIAPKLEAGLIDEMSFAFRITSGQWSPDFSQYRINAVDLHRGDVSIVGWGANPHTSGGLITESAAPAPAARSTGLTRAALEAIYLHR
jgi:HK97 family phage prohead protease